MHGHNSAHRRMRPFARVPGSYRWFRESPSPFSLRDTPRTSLAPPGDAPGALPPRGRAGRRSPEGRSCLSLPEKSRTRRAVTASSRTPRGRRRRRPQAGSGSAFGLEPLALPRNAGVNVDDEPPARSVAPRLASPAAACALLSDGSGRAMDVEPSPQTTPSPAVRIFRQVGRGTG